MKTPKPKSGICDDFVKFAFSVIEALNSTHIDILLWYITVLSYIIYEGSKAKRLILRRF